MALTTSVLNAGCVFIVLSALTQVTSGKFVCATDNFKTRVVQCYKGQAGVVAADAIFAEFQSSPDQDVTTLLAALLASDGQAICNISRNAYKSAVRCIYQVNRDCNSPLTKNIVANPSDAAKMVDPLCDNRQDVDFECVQRKGRSFQACIEKEQKQISDLDREVILLDGRCYVTNSGAYCAKSEYRSCGCATSKTYSDIVYDILQPSTCIPGNDTDHRVFCRASDRQQFISDGLNHGKKIAMLMWLPLLSVIVSGGSFRLWS